MFDINRQIEYWISNAQNDLDSADLLIESGKVLHGLFFCHLVIEKAIKAHIVKVTKEIPPRSHNLIYLSEKAELKLETDVEIFLGVLMKYQLEGRYPDFTPEIPSRELALKYLTQTKKLFTWLRNQL